MPTNKYQVINISRLIQCTHATMVLHWMYVLFTRVYKGLSSFYLYAHTYINFFESLFQSESNESRIISYILCLIIQKKCHPKSHGSPNPTRVGLTGIHPLLHGTNIIGKGGIWRAISSQIPGCDRGRQPPTYVNPPSSPPT